MNIEILEKKVICSNPDGIHNYFGWPTVARLQDGSLAMVASGFRVAHACSFGKGIGCYSWDDGENWSAPSVLLDTPLDDRDMGIVPFGENNVVITSFNCTPASMRYMLTTRPEQTGAAEHLKYGMYIHAYLDLVERNWDWEQYYGSVYRISNDGGRSFGKILRIPITSPHGPAAMPDGSLLYVGTVMRRSGEVVDEKTSHIHCYRMFADGSYEFLCELERSGAGPLDCEPHAVVLKNGKIIVHIRVHGRGEILTGEGAYTTYQSESYDGGRSFTKPHPILPQVYGAPAHLMEHNGLLISSYSYKNYKTNTFGVAVMFSKDDGVTWDTNHILTTVDRSDFGYPSTVTLKDGSMLTVYYEKTGDGDYPAVVKQIKWRFI